MNEKRISIERQKLENTPPQKKKKDHRAKEYKKTEMKNSIEKLNNRLDQVEERINLNTGQQNSCNQRRKKEKTMKE